MRFRLVVVGRLRGGPLAEAIAAMEARVGHYWPIEVKEVRAETVRTISPDDARRREAKRIVEQLGSPTVIASDERGVGMRSAEFASWLKRLQEGASNVDIVIGGAFGLDESVRRRATKILSLAPWTLSHDLARLVLAEQMYRAGTILRGEPYHKS